MKSIYLSGVLVLLCLTPVFSQLNKGNNLVGANLGIDHTFRNYISDQSEHGSSMFTVSPNYGYFINNNTVIGLNLGLQYNKRFSYFETTDYDNINTIIFTLPYIKYYHPVNDKLFIYGLFFGGPQFGTGKLERTALPTVKENIIGYKFGISPGLSISVTQKCFLDLSFMNFGYDFKKTTEKDTDDVNKEGTLDLNFNSISFGFNLIL